MPALVGGTGPVGGELCRIHAGACALGLGAVLGAHVHELGVLEIQIPFTAPILASTADGLLPLKFRNGCFLHHYVPLPFYDFNDPHVGPVRVS